MTVVALTLIVALVVLAAVFAGVVARMQRAHARREDLLVNQICHLAGRDWHPAPADELEQRRHRAAAEAQESARVRFTPSPEQQPIQ